MFFSYYFSFSFFSIRYSLCDFPEHPEWKMWCFNHITLNENEKYFWFRLKRWGSKRLKSGSQIKLCFINFIHYFWISSSFWEEFTCRVTIIFKKLLSLLTSSPWNLWRRWTLIRTHQTKSIHNKKQNLNSHNLTYEWLPSWMLLMKKRSEKCICAPKFRLQKSEKKRKKKKQ